MALKQREMNRKALEMAAAMVRDADFEILFGDEQGDGSESDDEVMHKAQAYAARRIEALMRRKEA